MLNKIHILGSSSEGCAYILHFSDKIIQLDAGVKNPDIEKVNELYISHLHNDHYQEKFFKKFNLENLNKIIPVEIDCSGRNRLHFDRLVWKHGKTNDAICNGYIIKEENEVIGYITDCGNWQDINYDFSKLTYLFIECNWDYFLIKQKVISGDKHGWMYAFTKNGHMSNLDCLNAIAKWKINKDCKIILIHKSQDHANYISSYKMFESLPNKVAIAPRGDGTIWCKAWTYTGDDRGRILK